MGMFGESVTESALQSPKELSPIVYLVSGKTGLGHASRAVALAQEFGDKQPVIYATPPEAQSFIEGNLNDTNADYDFLPLDYKPKMKLAGFKKANPGLFSVLEKEDGIVINDFLTQIPLVRAWSDIHGNNKRIVGLYHSIDGYKDSDPQIQAFQKKYRKIAKALNLLFLAEPRVEQRKPYSLKSGTAVVPCSPVVRRVTKSEKEIKHELGLEEWEDYILIQGGMNGNGELKHLVNSLQKFSLDGIKKVFIPYRMHFDPKLKNDPDTIIVNERPDGHNLIAAAVGVISKPGMGTTSEAIAYRKPLLVVNDKHGEPKLKLTILQEILGDKLPYKVDVEKKIGEQVLCWFENHEAIAHTFGQIKCDGAQEVVEGLGNINEYIR